MRFLKHAFLAALLAAVPSALVVSAKERDTNIRGSGTVESNDLPAEDPIPVLQEDSTANEPERLPPKPPKPSRRRGLPDLVDGETPPLHPREEASNPRTCNGVSLFVEFPSLFLLHCDLLVYDRPWSGVQQEELQKRRWFS